MIQAARRLQLARPGEGTDLVTKSSEAGGTSAFLSSPASMPVLCEETIVAPMRDAGSGVEWLKKCLELRTPSFTLNS